MHLLFGSALAVDATTLTGMLWVSGFSLIAMGLIYKPLLLDTLDPLFLQTVSRLGPLAHGLFLTLVVLNLVIGFQAIGALMVVGLMMLPAIASRFWSRRLPVLIAVSAVLGCLSVWLGLLLSFYYSLPSGPAIVLVAGAWVPAVRGLRSGARFAAPPALAYIPMRCFPMRALLVLFSLLLPLSMAQAADKLQVVTSFSILDDITHQIGGDHIQISNMVGPDADAHTYEPTPDDAKALLKAKLIIKNGLGFEPWLDRLVTSTETKATVVTASKGVISHTMEEDGETIPDPHAWHNLANAEIYVNNITKALVAADPANKADYQRNSQTYLKEIYRLLAEAKTKFGALPPGNRRIVTSHDAFGYLGQAYGIQFLAPQGLSTEREPSAAEVAALITQIRKDKVKAVFMENIKDSRLLKQIADESGAQIGGTLYSDALAAEGPASTFTGLFEYNLNTLCAALSKP